MKQKELPEGVVLRPLTAADVPAMARLEREIFTQEAWSEDTIAAELASPWSLYLGLFAEGQEFQKPEVVPSENYEAPSGDYKSKDAINKSRELEAEPYGSQKLCESQELKPDPRGSREKRDSRELIAYGGIKLLDEADLMVVAVSTAWRGRGLGRFLLHALHREAAARNIHRIILEVRASNTPAQQLYLAEGYRKVNVIKNYYRQPVEDAWLMIRDL